jgi:hypothetical protein
MIYVGGKSEFSINLNKLAPDGNKWDAFWIDLRDGTKLEIRIMLTGSAPKFSTPGGWEDALLVFERAGG